MAFPAGGDEGGSKTLNLKVVLEGSDYLRGLIEAVAATEDFQEKVRLLEEFIKEAASTADTSFETIAKATKKIADEFGLFSKNTEKALSQALSNVAQEAKTGFTTAAESAASFREQVELVKQQITSLSKEKGLSFQDIAEGMRKAGNESRVVNTALKELTTEINKAAEAGKKLTPEQELERYRSQIEALKNQIRELAQLHQVSFRDAGQALINTGAPAKETTAAIHELNEETKQTVTLFEKLGTAGQFAFGTVLGVTAIGVVRQIVQYMREATSVAIEFSRANFQLELAVRGLQRVGVDTTIQRFRDNVKDLRAEFKAFTERELSQASAQLALYTREVGFSEEQIFDLTRVSAALATVTGKDVGETGFLVARALASGYTEALQRMGIAISRADITQRAMADGLNKSFIQLTEQERAAVSLELVHERTAAILEDVTAYYESYAGRIDVANEKTRDLQQTLGQFFLPTLTAIKEGIGTLAQDFLNFQVAIRTVFATLYTGFASLPEQIKLVGDLWNAYRTGGIEAAKEVAREFSNTFNEILRQNVETALGIETGLGDALDELGKFATDAQAGEELVNTAEEIQNRLADEQLKGQQRRIDILLDFARKREDILRDNGRKIEDLERDLQNKLLDLSLSYNERINKLVEDYELRRAQIIRDASNKSQEQEAKRKQQAIDDERKFQERLLKLQEDFLLNLEDAVRERDALSIIRLTRRFNLEKKQLIREYEDQRKSRDEQAALERQQLENQKNERLRQLDEEHALRLVQIKRQEELERLEARLDFQRKSEEEQIRLQQRLDDLNLNRQQELEDLKRGTEERLAQVLQGWLQEGKVTQENADAIYDIIAGTFGPGGRIEGVYLYFLSLLQSLAAGTSALTSGLPSFPVPDYHTNPETQYTSPSFQTGGSLIATRPTTAVFGERPELVTFTPLTGPNVGKVVGNLPAGIGSGLMKASQIFLGVSLSPDLEARILDQAQSDAADVIVAINRGR